MVWHEQAGLVPVEGDVGIEIEVEGMQPLPTRVGEKWRSEMDGSLRGYSMEYVLKEPCPIERAGTYLKLLKHHLKKNEAEIIYSERAGSHVHVNVQDLTWDEIVYMSLVYYCLEVPLIRYCGPNRVGNHFCLRVKDAEWVLEPLERAIKYNTPTHLRDEDIRYAALNFNSLFSYGSLEFRAMEVQPDFSKIGEFAKMLVAIREFSRDQANLKTIPQMISGVGPTGWAKNILGEELFKLIDYPEFDMDVMRGCQLVQHLFYVQSVGV